MTRWTSEFSPTSFQWSLEVFRYNDGEGWIAASAYFIRNRVSRQAMGKCFCTPTSRQRRGMEEHLSAWLSAVDSLPHFSTRLKDVDLNCVDFLLMQEHDGADTLFYCDPPYPSNTRVSKDAYSCEMSDERHCDLLNFLACCRGKFILSGYPCELYADLAEAEGWNLTTFESRVASSSARSKRTATECLWTNF